MAFHEIRFPTNLSFGSVGGPERRTTYESGMEPIGGAWIQFNIRYYMFALVFVVFDVETVFLYLCTAEIARIGSSVG